MGGNATQNSPTGDACSPRISCGNRRKFPVGTLVEVQTDEEDFKGVYFSATVVRPPNPPRKSGRKRSKKLYVEYQNLLAHEDGSDRLREYVNPSFVRPRPPLLDAEKGFELDDVVDAFYMDGWWTGVVTRVVDGGERFVVTFYHPPDELEFGLAELRAHWEWVKGCWVYSQKPSVTGLMFDVGRKVEVSFGGENFQEAWFPATILEDMGDGTFSVEYNTANTDTDGPCTNIRVYSLHIRPCPLPLKDKNFVLLEKVDAFFELGWWSGVVTKQLENSRYLVFVNNMKCEKEFNQSDLRPHMKWKDGKWFTSFQPQEPSIPSLDDGSCQHHIPENSSAYVATAAAKCSIDGEDTSGEKAHSSLISREDHSEPLIPDNLQLANVTAPLKKRIVNLSDSGDALSQPGKKLKKGNLVGENKKAMHDESDKEVSQVTCGFVSPEPLSNMEISVAQTTLSQSSCNHSWEENVQRKQRNSRKPQNAAGKISSIASSMGKSSARIWTDESVETDVRELLPANIAMQSVVNGDNQDNGGVLGEGNEKQPESARQSSGLVDRGYIDPIEPQNSPSVKITVATVLDDATQKQLNNGTQTASLPDGVSAAASEPESLPSVADTTKFDLLDKYGDKNLPENGTTTAPASVDIVVVVPSEPETLPFVKNTILWKTVESMEVFKKMPQKPHFRPLENFKKSSREGMAIAYMVTFSSLVERISRLQINDTISTIVDIKESLAELEKHGFDIRAVEDCINKLLAMKKVEEKLVKDSSTLDSQITEHDHKKSSIESDIKDINEQITMLQNKLSVAKSAKEKEDEEIAFLQFRQRETSDGIENAKNNFEGMVSSIL